MSALLQQLEVARAEVARLERQAQAATCAEIGCDMQSIGGCNCGCEFEDGTPGQCSVPVLQCTRCGDCDYGDNDEGNEKRASCARDYGERYPTQPPEGQPDAHPHRNERLC